MAIDAAMVLTAFVAFVGLVLAWVALPGGASARQALQPRLRTHRIARAPRSVPEPAAA